MLELLQSIVQNPGSSLLIVINLIVIESLLSVDNAAVLATMVMDLPASRRPAALKYGIIGAYLFRGICLFLASWLVHIWWLKPVGGFYLLYLVWSWWQGHGNRRDMDGGYNKQSSWLYRMLSASVGPFWATVILIEMMDLAFSIDNIVAAVAFTDNILLICSGVFIGILAMRFVAQAFVRLMESYPFLETSAYVAIAILGMKLSLPILDRFYPEAAFSTIMESERADVVTSGLTVAIFIIPLFTSVVFNVPARDRARAKNE